MKHLFNLLFPLIEHNLHNEAQGFITIMVVAISVPLIQKEVIGDDEGKGLLEQ